MDEQDQEPNAGVRRWNPEPLKAGGRQAWGLVRPVLLPALALGAMAMAATALYRHPPMQVVEADELGIRSNTLLGGREVFREGLVLVIPGIHSFRRQSLADQVYRPDSGTSASGDSPYQTLEGLSLGLEITVRYAIQPAQASQIAVHLPEDPGRELVGPALKGVVYRTLSRYTVREVFSTKRAEIQEQLESGLKKDLLVSGLDVHGVQLGRVDLPADYRAGLEGLLSQQIETEKMRYTLELQEKQIKRAEFEAEADKVRRETAASAAAREQVIAAQAQEEAMKHVLPFKQKQIEQRQLEAEAEKVARVRAAEGSAEARRIEAQGEADSRLKLADAEVYRIERIAKAGSEQMERDGAVLSKHPLLIQKIMAEKLSDKVQVIIAPPAAGGFIGAALLGRPTDGSAAPGEHVAVADSGSLE